jgi:hypothetical protein
VQEPFTGIVPPVRVTAEALEEGVPPQVVLAAPETTKPLGNVSVSGAVIVAAVPALLNVIVKVEVPPAVIVDGLKALPSVTPEGDETDKVAMAGPALLPLLVCKAPAASELM